MMDASIQTLRRVSFGVLLLAFAAISPLGCAHFLPQQSTEERPAATSSQEQFFNQWHEAMIFFEKGDFASAHDIFERLSHEETDPRLQQQALFAMACMRLIQAKSPEEFRSAVNVWELWKKQYQPSRDCEDPRLLTPLLQNLPAMQERALLSQKLKEQPRTSHCTKRLEEKDKEIQELRKRLRALESIHQEIEEKKKGLAD
ncbi:hypothetical protein SAMN02746041_01193 [Desulfacinum hydrothermale DSM 13146]|uniref:Tetratricopeptide repeat-containing protein n=1 Tax=Desulfacinum hydrothermale DSM 13146 TaxID=1121390 RepID=A0A1W1XCI4_9BACT|nr:hypothetical protein [Desulfacinum hydrothermale]SMC21504.1 hypothetical protein SAMN02746041_01193 [Desulfacinum hydrothermale DSM 13146]